MYWIYTGLLRDVVWCPNVPSAFRLRCTDIRSNRRRYSANASGVACDGPSKPKVGTNQVVDARLRKVDVRIAQQGRQVVGVGAHARVLEIDDAEAPIVEHQIAAVIVAMAQHARLVGELAGNHHRLLLERAARRRRQPDAAVGLQKMFYEKIQLPHQLVSIERNAERDVFGRLQLRAFPLHPEHELNRLLVERVVLGRLRHAQMGLEGDVAQIFEDENAEVVRMARDRGHGQRDVREQPADVDERQLVENERLIVDREHHRRVVGAQDAEVLTGRRVAGQRHDAHLRPREFCAMQTFVDSRARVLKRWRSPFHS